MVARGFTVAEPSGGHRKMIVFLSGLSGVGKTTTAKAFVRRYTQFRHIIASDLIRRAGANPQARDYAEAQENQHILLTEFAAMRRSLFNPYILLDGHMVIETAKGDHVIDDCIVDGLCLSHFVAIIDDPKRIYSTRRTIQRAPLSLKHLTELQGLEVAATRRQAERTGCPFIQMKSGAVDFLAANLGVTH